jgi:hypothetical protein
MVPSEDLVKDDPIGQAPESRSEYEARPDERAPKGPSLRAEGPRAYLPKGAWLLVRVV